MDNDNTTQEHVFSCTPAFKKEKLSKLKGQVVITIAAVVISIVGGISSKYPVAGGEAAMGAVILWFISMIYAENTLNSDVVTDAQGLRRYWYGKLWKTTRWEDIESVRVTSYPLLGDGYKCIGMSLVYELRQSNRFILACFKGGPIVFPGTLPNADKLCEIINEHVLRRNLPVIDKRAGTKGQRTILDRLPMPPQLNLPEIW